MGLKVFILNIVLSFFNFFVKACPIDPKKVSFVSLESNTLQDDMKMIYDEIKDDGYHISLVLTTFQKNNLWTNFTYFLNTIKQLYVINTSALVILNDNNFVVSKYKRDKVKVIQLWHASGAIKKFGNVITRSYPIANYDYVLCNGNYWIKPYSAAFSVQENQVLPIGMPRLDCVVNAEYMEQERQKMFSRYPEWKGKHIVLYAPTFRGDIYQGVHNIPIQLENIAKQMGDDTIVIYKCHPLLHNVSYPKSSRVYNMTDEKLYSLFSISECLISDFSSIVLDYALLNKPVYAYVPDLQTYLKERGCFVDFYDLMQDNIAETEEQLISIMKAGKNFSHVITEKYIDCKDGKNLTRTVSLIHSILQEK